MESLRQGHFLSIFFYFYQIQAVNIVQKQPFCRLAGKLVPVQTVYI